MDGAGDSRADRGQAAVQRDRESLQCPGDQRDDPQRNGKPEYPHDSDLGERDVLVRTLPANVYEKWY